ncbi:MAG TPA: hypothetical protein VNO22_12965 [Planctomycetota bacterium]|nr:hypothetical protein [Planctomycetota bacterium]
MRKALILTLCGSLLLGGCVAYEHRSYDPGVTPVSHNEVVAMTRAGYSEAAILERIRKDGVERRPTADDIVALKEQGVSSAVLNALLEAPVTVPRPARETRTVVYDYEPAILVGAAAVFGYVLGRHSRTRVHVHTAYCVH